MRAASLLVAATALAVIAGGFIKMSQNTFVESSTASFIARNRPTVQKPRSALGDSPVDYSQAKGAKAIVNKWLQTNMPQVSASVVEGFKTTTLFGTKSEKNRAMTLPKETIDKSFPLMLTLSVDVMPTEDEQKAMVEQIKKCENGGVVFAFNNSPKDFVKEDGFLVSFSFLAIDCKTPAGMEVLGFSRAKGGSFKPTTIERTILVCKKSDEWLSDEVICKKVKKTIKVPVEVDDELKEKTTSAIKFLLHQELAQVAK